jgi:hypothetical protein
MAYSLVISTLWTYQVQVDFICLFSWFQYESGFRKSIEVWIILLVLPSGAHCQTDLYPC